MARRNHRKGLPTIDFNELQATRFFSPKCGGCGKETFLSQEAAEAGLHVVQMRRMLEFGDVIERQVYRCKFVGEAEEVWHLSSNEDERQEDGTFKSERIKVAIKRREERVQEWQ